MKKPRPPWTAPLRASAIVFSEEELAILDQYGARLARKTAGLLSDPKIAGPWRKYRQYEKRQTEIAALEEKVRLLDASRASMGAAVNKLYDELTERKALVVLHEDMILKLRARLRQHEPIAVGEVRRDGVASTVCSACLGDGGVGGGCRKCGGTGWIQP